MAVGGSVRRFLLAVVLLALGSPSLPVASAASAPVLRRTVEVSGRAGESLLVRLPARAATEASGWRIDAGTAGWAGAALFAVTPGDVYAAYNNYYVNVRITPALVCPGRSCTPVGPDLAESDGALRAGLFRLVLLGPAGTRVRVTMTLAGLPAGTSRVTARPAGHYRVETFQAIGTEGHQHVLDAHDEYEVSGPSLWFGGVLHPVYAEPPYVTQDLDCGADDTSLPSLPVLAAAATCPREQHLVVPPAALCACPPGSEPLQSARFAYGGGPLPTDETYTLETGYHTVVVAPYALTSVVRFDALLPLDA